ATPAAAPSLGAPRVALRVASPPAEPHLVGLGRRPDRSTGVDAMDHWRPTRALQRAIGLVSLLLVLALVFGRPDLVVLALPLVVGSLWALWRRPATVPDVVVRVDRNQVGEGERFTAVASVSNATGAPLGPVVVTTELSRWLRPDT